MRLPACLPAHLPAGCPSRVDRGDTEQRLSRITGMTGCVSPCWRRSRGAFRHGTTAPGSSSRRSSPKGSSRGRRRDTVRERRLGDRGRLASVVARGYSEDPDVEPKVVECLHIAHAFERADEFDVIHNSFDFLPLTYSGLVETPVLTTIHGFSSPRILPVYSEYNATTDYVAISDADRHPSLDYLATIHHGIDTDAFSLHPTPGGYLLFFGRIHPGQGHRRGDRRRRRGRDAARDRRDRPGPAATSTSGSRRGSTASGCRSSEPVGRGASDPSCSVAPTRSCT